MSLQNDNACSINLSRKISFAEQKNKPALQNDSPSTKKDVSTKQFM